jgi:hypothetical protein
MARLALAAAVFGSVLASGRADGMPRATGAVRARVRAAAAPSAARQLRCAATLRTHALRTTHGLLGVCAPPACVATLRLLA